MRLLIADDHQIVRDCIKALLKNEENIEIVGEASTGTELLSMYQSLTPDIILTDINMPEMEGWEVMQELKEKFNFTKVIALTMFSKSNIVKKMMDAGASGYILKNTGKQELILSLTTVNNGGKYISPEISMNLLNSDNAPSVDSYNYNQGHKGETIISKRELEVLKLVVKGFTNQEIADKLFNSKRTIESHRSNILEKTGCKNSAELVKYAFEKGILENEPADAHH